MEDETEAAALVVSNERMLSRGVEGVVSMTRMADGIKCGAVSSRR